MAMWDGLLLLLMSTAQLRIGTACKQGAVNLHCQCSVAVQFHMGIKPAAVSCARKFTSAFGATSTGLVCAHTLQNRQGQAHRSNSL